MSIASRIETIEEHISNIYDTLELGGADLTNIDKNIINIDTEWKNRLKDYLANGIEVVWDNWEKVVGEGTELSLSPTIKGRMKIELKGNTYQYSTTGKNKLGYTLDLLKTWNTAGTWSGNVYTYNSLTFTVNDDMSISVKGTASANTGLFLTGSTNQYVDLGIENGSYILSGSTNGGEYTWALFISQKHSNNTAEYYYSTGTNGVTFTKQEGDTFYAIVRIQGNVYVNQTFYPMIRVSSATSEYEEPTGGIASPNPDYPQDIQVVSGDNEINVYNDVFDNSQIELGKTWYGTVNANRGRFYIELTLNQDYIVKVSDFTNINQVAIIESSSITEPGDTAKFTEVKTEPFEFIHTFNSNATYLILQFQSASAFTQSIADSISCKIGKRLQTYPINLPVENLSAFPSENNTVIATLSAGTYTFSLINKYGLGYNLKKDNNSGDTIVSNATYYSNQKLSNTFTLTETTNIFLNGYSLTTGQTFIDGIEQVQLEKGTKVNTYTPYGTTPIELCKIGTYQDKIDKSTGKNLFNKSSTPIYYGSSMQYEETSTGCKLKTSSLGSGFVLIDLGDIKNYENKTLTFSMSNTANSLYQYIAFIGCDNNGENRLTIGNALGSSSNTLTTTIGSGYTQTRLTIRLYIDGGTANTYYELNNIMVEINNQATSYEPYGTSWYLHKEIGKVVLNGSEDWYEASNNIFGCSLVNLSYFPARDSFYNINGICNILKGVSASNLSTTDNCFGANNNNVYGRIDSSETLANFKTLLSNKNLLAYYILKTPTNTEITGTLATQLEALRGANSYDTQTNVSQINDDLGFILNVSALKEM